MVLRDGPRSRLSSITQILTQIGRGEAGATEQLLPLVYAELRRLAARNLSQERSGRHDATSLVHEAYMRLAGTDKQNWNSRGHFYAAAAEAMRRILIDDARRRRRPKHGGDRAHVELDRVEIDRDVSISADGKLDSASIEDVLAIDEALQRFAAIEPDKAQLVKMRYFGGLSLEESASALGISLATAKRHWAYARAWLFEALDGEGADRRT
jgi:RNA polymerase sigma factor (TIGR02999 family)